MPWICSYGTLQEADVQRATFGRLLAAQLDALRGHALTTVPVRDPAVAAGLGTSHHRNVIPSRGGVGRVSGMALAITEAELAQVDAYEAQFNYRREAVVLESGRSAWVYVYATAAVTESESPDG